MGSVTPPIDASALAIAWSRKHPELHDRCHRAVGLVEANKVRKVDDHYLVEGTGDTYLVYVDPEAGTSRCTCEDSRKGNHCKHRIAVAMVYVMTERGR
jgi:uncharacterized Zn finger protein